MWIKDVLQGKPIEVWGGDQRRDFTYLDDAVEALLLAAAKPEAVGGVFNLGGMGHITLRELAETLVEVAGKGSFKIRAFPAERRKIDIGDFYSDCRLIGAVLGWETRTTIRQALTKTVAYYKKELPHYL